ncbi:MAG: DNA-directed RNA polymerase subunit alpha [Ignavibacteria bacterium CG_4_8_14_3_um_filter_37_9]|nr:DNA-directed RNA polymerase subunit alpha [Ignavibacteria bacterium]OIO24120.1 MAG: DNA-directed RNA polymerase subunit alpha [Ignavibacteria bacterium CG1_02_37_35]PIP79326.1 MAG: DNA-directed RNA polymerase subunit alpha [Ignavibacteria bacterium CG22_combo_CG10-13_8_21_14_all_37_15]PIS44756.1 MAG: DNA-directed RNA polymerase subunit alpha [Ignavibacteria bacterium CG08_land_8_20_14_0_20_37_9]PIW98297.1 MAG: DNA-directed RNA polymerase subunit alpha [Ignavibacteria bacterium CG_4_8_14_3_um
MTLVNFKMPEMVVLDDATFTNDYGKFSLQPLERGYGVTLGNSLRRVLISSLPGAAIVAVKFSHVLHEFSTIQGVVEDTAEIILNLKQVRLKLLNKKPTKIDLSFSGEGEFKASDIQKQSAEIEILNPDLHIATLNKSAKFDLELRIGRGRGFIPAGENKSPEYTLGTIPIDSIYTPIRNVKYDIENVRIGDKNDFEKLTLEIWTDGSIAPDDALTQSAKILKDHIQLFINLDLEPEEKQAEIQRDSEKERIKKILLTNVDDLELSVRAHNCLKAANIKNIAELVKRDESEMLKFRNFGRKSLSELTEIVETLGLEFGMDIDTYIKDENENN